MPHSGAWIATGGADPGIDRLRTQSGRESYGALMPRLYASYAALQAADVYTTRRALASGGREANAVMRPVVRNPA